MPTRKTQPPSRSHTQSPDLRAVVFTHFGSLEAKFEDDRIEANSFYEAILKTHLNCGQQVGLVYVYIDAGLKATMKKAKVIKKDAGFEVETEVQIHENGLKGFLRRAEQEARNKMNPSQHKRPKICYVGITELVGYMNDLTGVDGRLQKLLCGKNKAFTYDSPKFVESIIRLARGTVPHLARQPIIRIDEDAAPTPRALEALISTFKEVSRKEQVFFFSGVYGGADKKVDPTNDFAVRTHWFDKRDCYKTFLADMAVLGAPQSDGFKKEDCSVNLQKSLSARKLTLSKRSSAQVISGAGLVVSRTAVSFLPPFMNFQTLTTWVDDFAKRLLHEEIDDMRYEEKESVKEARLQQHRPDQEPDKTEEYFKRLLRGCLLVALIRGRKHLNGRKRTPFADMVEKVVNYRIARKIPDRRALRNKMLLAAKKQCDLVLNCWSSDEFYERASYKWAMTRDPKFKKEVCRELVADAIGYLDLLLAWPIFVHTAEKLRFLHNDWLFEDF